MKTPRMVALVAPIFVLGAAPGDRFHFVANGDRAAVEWGVEDASGRLYASVNVSRGYRLRLAAAAPAPATAGTYLFYTLTRCDASGHCVAEEGYGTIPDDALTGNGQGQMRLSVNTAGLPDFYGSGPGGLVEIEWKRDGARVWTSKETRTLRSAQITERRQGTRTAALATASGQLLGVPIGASFLAEIGTSHQVSIRVIREP